MPFHLFLIHKLSILISTHLSYPKHLFMIPVNKFRKVSVPTNRAWPLDTGRKDKRSFSRQPFRLGEFLSFNFVNTSKTFSLFCISKQYSAILNFSILFSITFVFAINWTFWIQRKNPILRLSYHNSPVRQNGKAVTANECVARGFAMVWEKALYPIINVQNHKI